MKIKSLSYKRVRTLTMTAILSAFLCVLSPFSINIGPVPITLASFAVYVVSSVASPAMAGGAVFVYIALGTLGFPVFSGFEGGVHKLIGPTGGYIAGFLILAMVNSIIIGAARRRKWVFPLGMIAGTALLYLFGTVWYSIYTDVGFLSAAAVCVTPFLLTDALKIAAASVIGISLEAKSVNSKFFSKG